MSETTSTRIAASLLAVAVGENLAARRAAETATSGTLGPLDASEGRLGPLTQLCLFTTEALLICGVELERSDQCLPPARLEEAYRRWLVGSGQRPSPADQGPQGWLALVPTATRAAVVAPGLGAALGAAVGGRLSRRPNQDAGAESLVRAVPAGFLVPGFTAGASPEEAYHLGCETAVVTHGSDAAVHADGCLAALVCCLVAGEQLAAAVARADGLTTPELSAVLSAAVELGAGGAPSAEALEGRFGRAERADDALGVALACAAGSGRDVALGASACLTVPSSAASAACGALVGARDGIGALPEAWLGGLEGRWLVAELADDVVRWLQWGADAQGELELGERFLERYG